MTQPVKHYDLSRYRQRLADAVDPMKVKKGPSQWLDGRSVTQAQAEADAEARVAFKEIWDPRDVANISKGAVERFASAAAQGIKARLPAPLRERAQIMKANVQTVPGRPHHAFTAMLQIPIRLADGSRGVVGVSASNFRAEIAAKDGKIAVGEIERKNTNEEQERVLYGQVYRIDENGRNLGVDSRYGKDGTVFRLSGSALDPESIEKALSDASKACCRLAGVNPAPAQKPAPQQAQTQGQQSRAERIAAYEAQQAQRSGGPSSSLPPPTPSMGGRRAA